MISIRMRTCVHPKEGPVLSYIPAITLTAVSTVRGSMQVSWFHRRIWWNENLVGMDDRILEQATSFQDL